MCSTRAVICVGHRPFRWAREAQAEPNREQSMLNPLNARASWARPAVHDTGVGRGTRASVRARPRAIERCGGLREARTDFAPSSAAAGYAKRG